MSYRPAADRHIGGLGSNADDKVEVGEVEVVGSGRSGREVQPAGLGTCVVVEVGVSQRKHGVQQQLGRGHAADGHRHEHKSRRPLRYSRAATVRVWPSSALATTYHGIASEASAEASQVATGPGRPATVRWRPAQSRFRPAPEPLRTAGAPASCWSATAAERSTSGGLLGARRPRGLVRSRVWGRGAQVVERQTGHAHDVA